MHSSVSFTDFHIYHQSKSITSVFICHKHFPLKSSNQIKQIFGDQNIKLFSFSAWNILGSVLTLSSFCLLSSSIPALAVQKIGTTTFSKLILSSLAFFLTLQKRYRNYFQWCIKIILSHEFSIYSQNILFHWLFGKKSMPVAVHRRLFYIISRINQVEYVLVVTC